MYLPVKTADEVNLGASFTVSNVRLPAGSGPDDCTGRAPRVADIAVQLLAGSDAEGSRETDLSSGEVDGGVAVRRERIVAADPERGLELASRRVEYLVAVPGDPDQWLVAAFSTIGAGDPRDDLADAMVEWFDALMMTFRWSWT
jgi:hypothetical protein